MPGQTRSATITGLFTLLLLAFFSLPADAQIKLDLPAQPLGQSLTAIGTLGHLNVMFDPSIVDGLQAPALKAELSADDALVRLLLGTRLHAVRVDANTIRVVAPPVSSGAQKNGARYSPASEHLTKAEPPPAQDPDPASSSGTPLSATTTKDSSEPQPRHLQEVIVTGSHIRGAAPSSTVITLDQSDIQESGYTQIGDTLRMLPENFAGGSSPQLITGSAPGNNANFSGGSAPNLRGLGSNSTLTLVNGHRLASETYLGAVDISLIPLDAVDRVEIVTDGASAIYGADAVAGVVNFVLKKEFNGAETSASVSRATEGGAFDRRISQTLGTTWTGGGTLLTYEHDSLDGVSANQRDFTSTVASPFSLLPSSSRNSIYGAIHENVSSTIEIAADGLYTSRDSGYVWTFPPTFVSNVGVKQYLLNASVNADLIPRWTTSLVSSISDQHSRSDETSPGSDFVADIHGRSRTFELDADGPLTEIYSGAVRAAFGLGYRTESYDYTTFYGGSSHPVADGARNTRYAFAELLLPLIQPDTHAGIHRLELTASGRYDRYSDFGSKSVPRVGLIYSPTQHWSVHGSLSRSFAVPTIYAAYGSKYVTQQLISDPSASSGQSLVLGLGGANSSLRPETARTWTAGLDMDPGESKRLHISATYYDIHYTNRIATIPSVATALIDPSLSQVVTRSPSPALQQFYINGAPGAFYNYTTSPYDPAAIAAIVDDRSLNLSTQTIDGVDLLAKWNALDGARFRVDSFLNGTYLELRQRLTSSSPESYLSGTTFFPPRFRGRAGATITGGRWSMTGIANYTGGSRNTFVAGDVSVGSWTTVDAQVAYELAANARWVKSLRAALSVQNLLDRPPPYVVFDTIVAGFHYDPVNASPIGRNVSLGVTMAW